MSALYRFGMHDFTLEEVRSVGRRHGEDGIAIYPPDRWDDVHSYDDCTREYLAGYDEGVKSREEFSSCAVGAGYDFLASE